VNNSKAWQNLNGGRYTVIIATQMPVITGDFCVLFARILLWAQLCPFSLPKERQDVCMKKKTKETKLMLQEQIEANKFKIIGG